MMSVPPRFQRFPALAGVVLLLLCALVRPALAGMTYHVATVEQLEAAIALVNGGLGGDLIVLAPGTYTLSSPLTIDQDVGIQGDPAAPSVIEGNATFDILNVTANNIAIQNLTLRNGQAAIIYQSDGVFTGTGLTITGNAVGLDLGASDAVTHLTNSTVANNSEAGITIRCTQLHLTNVTVSNNNEGVRFDGSCRKARQLTNSLIVQNMADCENSSKIRSVGAVGEASFDSDGSCVSLEFASGMTTRDVSEIDLGGLADNGGPTMTAAISATSVAVNAGNNPACPATDQRGFLRNDGACDIGAYEYGAGPGGGNTPPGTNVSVSPAPGVTVTFPQVTAGGDTTATIGGPLPPSGFQVDGVVYDISTTAVYTGPVTVCLPYSPSNPSPRLALFEAVPPLPPTWVDRTSSVDTVNHIVCATAPVLSPSAVLMPIDVSGQLQQLQVLINSYNLQKPAAKKFNQRLDKVRKEWAKHREHDDSPTRFCGELEKFIKFVGKETGKSLTASEASELLTQAQLIGSEVGCGF